MAEQYAEGNGGGHSEGSSENVERTLWRELRSEKSEALCERTGCKEIDPAAHEEIGLNTTNEGNGSTDTEGAGFFITSFGQPILIDRENGRLLGETETARYLLNEKKEKFVPALLYYLARIERINITGELLKPSNIPGGIFFIQGTHVLPLDSLARKYNDAPGPFFDCTGRLGGFEVGYGDVACRIFVFPKMPITIVVRSGDDEFPPKGELYFDTSARTALLPNVLWGIADLTVELFLENRGE